MESIVIFGGFTKIEINFSWTNDFRNTLIIDTSIIDKIIMLSTVSSSAS